MQLAMMGIDSFAVTVGDDGVCVCVCVFKGAGGTEESITWNIV